MSNRIVQISHYGRLYDTLQIIYEVSASTVTHVEGPHNINAFTRNALSAFVLTTSIWESFVNWAFCSPQTQIYFGDDVARKCSSQIKEPDNVGLLEKTYDFPMIAFGKSFNKGASPYQDLSALVELRNHIVHDVPNRAPEHEIDLLRYRGCLLDIEKHPKYPCDERPWQNDVSTLESIRWCLNLLPKLVDELIQFSGREEANRLAEFSGLKVSFAKQLIKAPIQGVPFYRRKQIPSISSS